MDKNSNLLAYILKNYPYPDELSKARVTKMLYLADWRSCITNGHQLTDSEWVFDDYGPYVHDFADIAKLDPSFDLVQTTNFYGKNKELIVLKEGKIDPKVDSDEKEVLDCVIENTKKYGFEGFLKLVYSTFPIRTQPRYSKLDLVKLAKEYAEERRTLGVELA